MNKSLFEAKLCKIGLGYICPKLEETDFFTAPASSRFHGNWQGGLMLHSYTVAHLLEGWTQKMGLYWEEERSPVLIGLLHDVCKVGEYEKTEEGWKATNKFGNEHGWRSVNLLKEWGVELTEEERMCIWYHMGQWTRDIDTTIGDLNYSQVLSKYHNLLWVHTADMYASQILEI